MGGVAADDRGFLVVAEISAVDVADRIDLGHVVGIIGAHDDVVGAEDKPSIALRGGRNSSMRLAINAVQDGRAAGMVSAGNTGALLAMAKFVLKTLPGVDRPAIAGFFPTLHGESLMLDLGANVVCSARRRCP